MSLLLNREREIPTLSISLPKVIIRIVVAIIPAMLSAAILPSNGTQADVQAKIDMAANGDIIEIPEGVFTWKNSVNVAGKSIHLRGAGAGRVIARSRSILTVGLGTQAMTVIEESIPSLESLKSQLVKGANIRIWRNGGEILDYRVTGNLPWMEGTVTSFSGGNLTVDVKSYNLSGSHGLWIITTTPKTTVISDVNDSQSALNMSESTQGPAELSGVRFQDSPRTRYNSNLVSVHSGPLNSEPTLIHDCFFVPTAPGGSGVRHNSNRGIIWGCSFASLPASPGNTLGIYRDVGDTTSWLRPSTMGTLDATGKSNLYIEDCDLHMFMDSLDFDSNSRTVVRNTLFDNAGTAAHGADTSTWGARHYELYNCVFNVDFVGRGLYYDLNYFIYLRGGTGVITDCTIPDIHPADSSDKTDINLAIQNLRRNAGPNPLWGAGIPGIQYPCPRQVGMGYVTGKGLDGLGRSTDGITYVGDSEPLYIWNNSGQYGLGITSYSDAVTDPDLPEQYIISKRDYFHNAGPKPNYSKFQYPHPYRALPRFVQITISN
jgi:hypothetical protein